MKKLFIKSCNHLKENLLANNTTRQTIAKNTFWLFLAEGSNKGILFLVTILIARHFSVEEFGVFGFVFSSMTLIAMLADFGLTNITIRELANNREGSAIYFNNAISLKISLSFITFSIMTLSSVFMNPNLRMLAILAGIAILLEGMTDYLRISFRVSEDSQHEVAIKAAPAIILICLVFLAIQFKFSLKHVLLGYVVAHSLGLLLAIRLLDRKITISINIEVIRTLLIESWPMYLGLLCTSIYCQADLILIKVFRGFAEVGLYQAAYKLLFGFQLLRVVHMAMLPRLAILVAERNTAGYRMLIRQSILWCLVILVPIGIIALFFPTDIIRLVFGQEYTSAANALPFLIWSGIISFVNTFFSNTLMITGRQKIWLRMEFLVLVFLLIMEILLIPKIGFMGAAIATFTGETVSLVLSIFCITANSELRSLFFPGDQKEC